MVLIEGVWDLGNLVVDGRDLHLKDGRGIFYELALALCCTLQTLASSDSMPRGSIQQKG